MHALPRRVVARALVLSALVSLIGTSSPAAAPGPFGLEHALTLRSLSQVTWSPDGRWFDRWVK